jgi:hypothetical protein
MKKSRLQYTGGSGRKKKPFLRMEFKNVLYIGKKCIEVGEDCVEKWLHTVVSKG